MLLEIIALLPAESLLYVADSAHAPWGDKPRDFIRDRGLAISRFLLDRGAKAIVIGSNTGTAGAAEALRAELDVPVIGMEPGIKPAVAATRSGVVGAMVTATMGTSDRMASLLDRFGHDVRVISQPVPGLVEHVEAADLDSPALRELLGGYLAPMLAAGADTIVLGSTHYVFLRPLIKEIAGEGVTLVDTGAAVARQLKRRLAEADLLARDGAQATLRFWSSSDASESTRVVSLLLGRKVEVDTLP